MWHEKPTKIMVKWFWPQTHLYSTVQCGFHCSTLAVLASTKTEKLEWSRSQSVPSLEREKMDWGNVIQEGTSGNLLPPHRLIFTSKSPEKHCTVSRALMFLNKEFMGTGNVTYLPLFAEIHHHFVSCGSKSNLEDPDRNNIYIIKSVH